MVSLKNKILFVIAPHPDDEVLGCGGLIGKIKKENGKVYVLFMTNGTTLDFSSRGISTQSEREKEMKEVANFLHYDDYKIAFPGSDYHLRLDRLPQKDIMFEIEQGKKISLQKIRPDIIAFPAQGDYNQDHVAISRAAFAACRPTQRQNKFIPNIVLSYEEVTDFWAQHQKPNINFFVALSDREIINKVRALNIYKSQMRGNGHPRNENAINSLAILRGSAIGADFAEGFHCLKLIL